LQQRLELFATICDAVHFAHQRAVLHRDLKPGNILIDAAGQPHVLDFGVARSLAAPAEAMTQAGQFLGTLAYAAPEQVSGEPDGADVRSDVYALGVILYELLAGHPPYDTAGPIRDAIRAVTELLPQAPGRRVPGCGSSADTDAVVLKALAKEKERRYQSAAALAADLRRALSGDPVEARRGSRWYVFRKTVSRHRWALAAAAGFVIMLGAWGTTMAVLRERAAAERDRAQTEADKYRHIKEFFDDTFYAVKDPSAGDVTLRELLDESRHWFYVLEDKPEIEAAVKTSIGNWYRGVGAYETAAELLESGLAMHRDLFGEHSLEVARSLSSLGLLRRDEGDVIEAERLLREALNIRREVLGEVHVDVGYSLGNLATLLRDQGELGEAEALLREQLEVRRSLAAGDDASVALTLHNLAEVLLAERKIADAERMHREALALRERLLNPGHPDLVASCIALGELLVQDGRVEEAEPQLRECYDAGREHMPAGHPRRAGAVVALARCLIALQRPDEARAVLMAERPDGAAPSIAPSEIQDLLSELDSHR
jgi:tetratricopeptide (TPR) repeat protein